MIVIPEGIAFGAEGNSGSKWSVRAWQADDGLPDNNVTGIAQTSDGYLWVSTHAGLARFDGVRFVDQPLPVHGGISNSLVRTMLLGRGNELWLAGEAAGGLVVGFSGSSTNILTSAEGVPSFKPISMTQTPDGAVWVGYVDGSARRYYRGEAGRFGTREGLGGTGGCWLVTDQSGMLWFAKAGHVGVFERDHFVERFEFPEQIIRVAPARDGGVWILSGLQLFKAATNAEPVLVGTLPELRAGVEPSVLFESRQGQVWLGTKSGGLVLWNGRTFLPVATSHSDITSVFEDNEGNIWVGTEGGGLDRLRNQILELNGSSLGLPFETARSVCVDDQGTVWAAGANGTLVRQVNGQWKTMADALGWSNPRVTSVAGDEHGGVWVGTYHGGLLHWRGDRFESFSREDGLAGDVVRAMLVDSRGDLWIGLEAANCLQQLSGGKFKTFSQPTGSRTIRAIVEDVSGRIWLGTSDGYLLRVDGDHIVDETSRALQPTKPIRALHASKDGALWIGYAAAGLGLLRDGKFSKFGTEHGMPDNYICGIQSDDGGGLWFTASHGLFQIRQREFDQIAEGRSSRLLAVDFGRNEGLPNLQGSYGYWPAYAKDRIGNIWFATRSGLVSTSPSRVQANRIPPKVIIERLVVDGRVLPVRPGEVPVLTPNHRRIEVEFTALNFAAPDSILLQYRLAGWDENWSDPKPERSAVFSRMPAGLYEFQVAARNAAGIWNHEGARI
ncbi:MAG: hypothetical protein RLY20_555, partial [Verrucomicrobiota bacterium]